MCGTHALTGSAHVVGGVAAGRVRGAQGGRASERAGASAFSHEGGDKGGTRPFLGSSGLGAASVSRSRRRPAAPTFASPASKAMFASTVSRAVTSPTPRAGLASLNCVQSATVAPSDWVSSTVSALLLLQSGGTVETCRCCRCCRQRSQGHAAR
jgi:hypothetical protein